MYILKLSERFMEYCSYYKHQACIPAFNQRKQCTAYDLPCKVPFTPGAVCLLSTRDLSHPHRTWCATALSFALSLEQSLLFHHACWIA